MWWKIIIEILLALVSLILSSGFWNCIKSPGFLKRVVDNYDIVKKLYQSIDKDNLPKEAQVVNNQDAPYPVKIAMWIKSSSSALSKTRNVLFVIIIGIVYVSYFLGLWAFFINLFLIACPAFMPIVSSAQNNIIADVKVVLLNVYYWHQKQPKECEEFCTKEAHVLKTIYRVVAEV